MHATIQKQVNTLNFPPDILPSLREIKFVCPICKGRLNIRNNCYECLGCRKQYLLHDGIPDFRVFSDPFLNYKEDFSRSEIVIKALKIFNFEELLEHYWSFSDVTPEILRRKFIRSAVLGKYRAEQTLEIIESQVRKIPKTILEIGSGTGNFLALVIEKGLGKVVGIDIAMRWLHVSRRRFMDLGLEIPPLICCCAEFLPFEEKTFDLVVMSSTLEFVQNQTEVLSECGRVMVEDGNLFINTVNRFSIAPDPYSYLRGVGFLPRKLQAKYVKWRRDVNYGNIHTYSYSGLNRQVNPVFSIKKTILPDVSNPALKEFSSINRWQIKMYQTLKKLPGLSVIFKVFGPGWNLILQKRPEKVRI